MYYDNLKRSLVGLGVALIAIPNAAFAGDPVVDCQRALAKETQKYAQKLVNELRKCNDGLLKEGSAPAGCPAADPKGKAVEKIQKAFDKAIAGIEKKCAAAATDGDWANNGPANIGFLDNCPRADCAAVIDSESALASCATCVVDDIVDGAMAGSGVYGSVETGSSDKGVLGCQRTFGKELAQIIRKNSKAQQKCEDALIKAGTPALLCPAADPKGKASAKISKFIGKADDKIAKKCPDTATEGAALDVNGVNASFGSIDNAPEVATQIAQNIVSFSFNKEFCGDSIIQASETCDDGNIFEEDGVGSLDTCPADCFVGPCAVGGAQQVTVNFTSPANLIGLTIVLGYDDTVVELPGQGGDAAVQAALSSTNFTITPGDADYALRAVLSDPFLFGVGSGEAFVAQFNDCGGAVAPGDFSCTVIDAVDDAFASRDDVTCSVTVP